MNSPKFLHIEYENWDELLDVAEFSRRVFIRIGRWATGENIAPTIENLFLIYEKQPNIKGVGKRCWGEIEEFLRTCFKGIGSEEELINYFYGYNPNIKEYNKILKFE